MRKLVIILLFIMNSCAIHSQTNIEYDLYILLDSSKEVVHSSNLGNEDLLVRMFTINKSLPQESQKFSLSIDAKGKLIKSIRGNLDENRYGTLALSHTLKKHEKKQVLKISNVNFLDLETILNTKFAKVLELVQKSNKIYVIDTAEEDLLSNFYTAYEVQH